MGNVLLSNIYWLDYNMHNYKFKIAQANELLYQIFQHSRRNFTSRNPLLHATYNNQISEIDSDIWKLRHHKFKKKKEKRPIQHSWLVICCFCLLLVSRGAVTYSYLLCSRKKEIKLHDWLLKLKLITFVILFLKSHFIWGIKGIVHFFNFILSSFYTEMVTWNCL